MVKSTKDGTIACKFKKSHYILFNILIFIILYGLVAWLRPMNDDWYYLTSPNPDFSLSDLLPQKTFWRPFDALFGGFLSFCPALFPWINRFFVILAHIFNGFLIKKIANKICVNQYIGIFASCFFLFSSSCWAVIVSPDALNQAFSLLFGLLAILVHFNQEGYKYILFCIISIFWKESGISFFFIVPLFELVFRKINIKEFFKDKSQLKRTLKQIIFSLLIIIVYFIARFALQGEVSLGSDYGTYDISIFSISFIKNVFLLVASAATGIDTIALFGAEKSLILICITTILSLIFLVSVCWAAIYSVRKKHPIFPFFCLCICIFALIAPLAVIGHAGEMHAYPVLFGIVILFAYCYDASKFSIKKILLCFISIAIAFVISAAHKVDAIYEYNSQTKRVENEIADLYDLTPGDVLFVVVNDIDGYSVFSQTGIRGTYYGTNMRQYLDWKELYNAYIDVENMFDAQKYIDVYGEQYSQIFIVENDYINKVK